MNMSKYPSLLNSELLSYRALKNTYGHVMEALNLEIYNVLKNFHQTTPACQICTFYLEKYQSYKAFHVSYFDVVMMSYKPWIWK